MDVVGHASGRGWPRRRRESSSSPLPSPPASSTEPSSAFPLRRRRCISQRRLLNLRLDLDRQPERVCSDGRHASPRRPTRRPFTGQRQADLTQGIHI